MSYGRPRVPDKNYFEVSVSASSSSTPFVSGLKRRPVKVMTEPTVRITAGERSFMASGGVQANPIRPMPEQARRSKITQYRIERHNAFMAKNEESGMLPPLFWRRGEMGLITC